MISLLSGLPGDFPASLLVAQHLSSEHRSELAAILARYTPLKVRSARHGEPLQAGQVFVAPSGMNLELCAGGTLALSTAPRDGSGSPSADRLFQSLAEAVGGRAVVIVLSGLGRDGARGIRAVHAAGGVVLAQDLETSRFAGMPQSAIETGCVDFVLPPTDIARALTALTASSQNKKRYPKEVIQENPVPETEEMPESFTRSRLTEEVTRIRSRAEALYEEAFTLSRRAGSLNATARTLTDQANQLSFWGNPPEPDSQEDAEKKAAEKLVHGLFRDVLAAVTEGKLQLCETAADLPPALLLPCTSILLTPTEGLRQLRKQTRQEARALGLSEERCGDFVTATQEAGMNAVVHAGGGLCSLSSNGDATLQVRVVDRGSGIEVERLPRALLEKGYSTAGTFGHGMKMMILAADRLWLLTGPSGTTVVLEQDRVAPQPAWL